MQPCVITTAMNFENAAHADVGHGMTFHAVVVVSKPALIAFKHNVASTAVAIARVFFYCWSLCVVHLRA